MLFQKTTNDRERKPKECLMRLSEESLELESVYKEARRIISPSIKSAKKLKNHFNFSVLQKIFILLRLSCSFSELCTGFCSSKLANIAPFFPEAF
jgi:hypothetical protein